MPEEYWDQLEAFWSTIRATALQNNSVGQYAAAAITLLLVFVGLWIVKGLVTRRFTKWGETSGRHWARTVGEMGRATRLWCLLAVALFCGSLLLVIPAQARLVIRSLTIAALLIQSGFWGNKLMSFGVERFVRKTAENEGAGKMTAGAITMIGGIGLWSIVLLAILANFGVDVTAMVAGLGVGGIAIALAAQNILGDLFSSLSIVLDKPFAPGDFVTVGSHSSLLIFRKQAVRHAHAANDSGREVVS